MDDQTTLILTRRDIAGLMTPADYQTAVAAAFEAVARGRGASPAPMQLLGPDGGFHVKGAGFAGGELAGEAAAFAAFKVNGNFPSNPARRGLPTIQGAIVLCDGEDGRVLAVMDSIEVTLRRTAAATAVAASLLARPGAGLVGVCGCGEQARAQLEALTQALPLERALLADRDPARAETLAAWATRMGLQTAVARDLSAFQACDVIVTCTTSREAFLQPEHVGPGAFIAAVGADNPEKSEIAPSLMAAAAVVVDVLAQCLVMGDLRSAVQAGAMSAADVRAELGEVLTGARPGRRSPDEIIVFDSTGSAIQDVASAGAIYRRARDAGVGLRLDLGGA
jgi:ornithine cyclodeaminase/alanine dehydrogenase-like protein (mu-crystallin family)